MIDTHETVQQEWHDRLMAKSGIDRLHMGADMFSSSLMLMRAGIRASFGELDEIEIREMLLQRLYGNELTLEVRQHIAKN